MTCRAPTADLQIANFMNRGTPFGDARTSLVNRAG